MFSDAYQLQLLQEHKAEIEEALQAFRNSALRGRGSSSSSRVALKLQAWAPLPPSAVMDTAASAAGDTGADPVNLQVTSR